MVRRHILVPLAALLVASCSAPTGPAHLDGNWGEDFSFPGSAVEFSLVTRGDSLTGSGYWAGEACCSGTMAVTGAVVGREVHLTLSFNADHQVVPSSTTTFVGTLRDANTLSGTATDVNGSESLTFRRR